MDDNRVQVNHNLNDNSSSNQGGKEISRPSRPSGEPWSPEKPLLRFVTILWILRGISYGTRAIGFLWASAVLLPGLVNVPYGIDFYFIIIILLAEGARIFCLNYDLDWRFRFLWTVSDAVKSSCRTRWKSTCISKSQDHRGTTFRTSSDADDSSGHFLNKLLYCLQLFSASICITLSVVRFIQLSIHGDDIDPSTGGYRPEAYVFYGLAFFQAFFSLLEEVYWEWKITYRRLLEVVDKESKLGIDAIKSFCYHAYRECDKGNISDVLSFNLFLFASKLLNSHSRDDQLLGVRSLHKLSTNDRSATDTLQNIGKSRTVIQKLLHMLSWSLSEEAEFRKAAAEILDNLVGRSFNSFRLSGFLGSVDNISDMIDARNPDEIRKLGITIVEKLSHGSCGDIAHSEQLINRLKDIFSYDPVLEDYSARIIINLCRKKKEGCYILPGAITEQFPMMVMKKLMLSEVKMETPLQILIELARQLLRHLDYCDTKSRIEKAGEEVPAVEFLETNYKTGIEKLTIKLVQILQECHKLAILELPDGMTSPEQQDKVRETTASTIGLAIVTMSNYEPAAASMRRFPMEDELRRILEVNTSNLRCEIIGKLINCALKLLAGEKITSPGLERDWF